MKTVMIYPNRESEKSISGYAVNLIKSLRENDVDVDDLTYTAGKPMTLFKQFSRFKNYDIIHLQHEYGLLKFKGLPFFILYLLLFISGKKIATTMHTAFPLNEKMEGSFIKRFLRKCLFIFQNKIISRVSDVVFVHSDFFIPFLVKDYNFPRNKIVVLPQGIITGIKKTPKNKAKKELKISGNMFLIIGNLTPDNGSDIILKHADEIGKTIVVVSNPTAVNKNMDTRKIINYLNYLTKYAKNKKLSKNVRFDIAPINDTMPKWWTYFSAADFVLLAYRICAGSGIFTNAMAAETPVISSNIPFFRDIEKKYGCIKTVKNEGDYAQIIKDSLKPRNYKKMVSEAGRYLKERSWLATAKKYKETYSKLI